MLDPGGKDFINPKGWIWVLFGFISLVIPAASPSIPDEFLLWNDPSSKGRVRGTRALPALGV